MYVNPYWFGFAMGIFATIVFFILLIFIAGCKSKK